MAKKSEVVYTEIARTESKKLEKLMRAYRVNPYCARVIYFNGSKHEFYSSRLVKFERPNGDFEFAIMRKTFGVSVTNRMYSREKKETAIIYTKNKFYYSTPKKLTQLTYNGLHNFIHNWNYTSNITQHGVFQMLSAKFSWLRFIAEMPALHGTAFNTIIRYKLYNMNDALRHVFKCPLPVIKVLLQNNRYGHPLHLLKGWKEQAKYLKNIENLSPEMVNHHLFDDATRMARILDKKVNCSWSIKRLTEEHDKWSKEITHIILANEPKYDLTINKIYREFAEWSGYRLLTTNIDMLGEGMMQNHCVGTYINKVNNGECAIFHIEGYTLEVKYGTYWDDRGHKMSTDKKFYVNQFRGRHNASVPKELDSAVKEMVEEFNRMILERKANGEYIDEINTVKKKAEPNYIFDELLEF